VGKSPKKEDVAAEARANIFSPHSKRRMNDRKSPPLRAVVQNDVAAAVEKLVLSHNAIQFGLHCQVLSLSGFVAAAAAERKNFGP